MDARSRSAARRPMHMFEARESSTCMRRSSCKHDRSFDQLSRFRVYGRTRGVLISRSMKLGDHNMSSMINQNTLFLTAWRQVGAVRRSFRLSRDLEELLPATHSKHQHPHMSR